MIEGKPAAALAGRKHVTPVARSRVLPDHAIHGRARARGGDMPNYPVVARNFSASSENRIHSDDIAKRFGFTGALVPGVAVFGHLTWPLTQHFGTRWLEGSSVVTRFLKPAYDGEALTVTDREVDAGHASVECRNSGEVLLATLECTLEAQPPPPDSRAHVRGPARPPDRVEIDWDSIHVNEPFATHVWRPDEAHNREYAERVADDTTLFREGVLHPHAILSQANQALVRQFVMPAWIHTGSEIRFRKLLRVGNEIEVRAVPMEKWERKGHQFIKLYIAYVVREEVATEICHTAIFRVAGR
jgi:acyl dehydratase